MTKLNPRLPAGEANGLDDIAAKLVADPNRKRVLLAVVDCSKIVEDADSGDKEPVIRFRRIELLSPEDATQAETLLRRAMERRSGRAMLPFEVEDELTRLFADVTADGEEPDEEGEG